jgi:putative YjhG/YagF family dehydratase
MTTISSKDVLEVEPQVLQNLKSHAAGPQGKLPLTPTKLLTEPSGNLFALSQNAGMGWPTERLLDPEFLILSTHGGLRAADGTPVALGLHTGHWEVGLLVGEAAQEFRRLRAIPFAAACTDPCDGRSQGTDGMLDSLPYRNDAATVLRRLMRSLPTRRGVMGIATCDKGLPAMMMALASSGDYPAVLVPGGVTLLPEQGEDAGKAQTIGARFAQQEISLEYAAEVGCRTCATPGGGCQFLGTAASSQVTAEALGLALPATALAPSGHAVWRDSAVRSARALLRLDQLGIGTNRILTDAALRNAMVLHAAFGGSTNMLLHIPAIAHAAGLRRPKVDDWAHINRQVPRLVDALPNGPRGFATVQVFLAGGVPEVMLRLREASLLDCSVLTSSGETLGTNLDWWADSEARREMNAQLLARDGIDAGDVIMSPAQARSRGLTPTVCFPTGNLAPQGSVIKSTAIDPSLVDEADVYRHIGPARVFITEAAAIDAIKRGDLRAGDVVVLICGGPLGAGMQETYQVTSALKTLQYCKNIAVVTDARFSGVSTGACIGHISPEALAGGPIGKIRDRDMIEIIIDRAKLQGSINFVGEGGERFSAAEGVIRLKNRASREDLAPHPHLPEDTRIWAALIEASGGVWGGCVYDANAIVEKLTGTPQTPE